MSIYKQEIGSFVPEMTPTNITNASGAIEIFCWVHGLSLVRLVAGECNGTVTDSIQTARGVECAGIVHRLLAAIRDHDHFAGPNNLTTHVARRHAGEWRLW